MIRRTFYIPTTSADDINTYKYNLTLFIKRHKFIKLAHITDIILFPFLKKALNNQNESCLVILIKTFFWFTGLINQKSLKAVPRVHLPQVGSLSSIISLSYLCNISSKWPEMNWVLPWSGQHKAKSLVENHSENEYRRSIHICQETV